MGSADDDMCPPGNNYNSDGNSIRRAAIPPPQPFVTSLKNTLKETFFPDDPLKQFKNQPTGKKVGLGLRYFFPILEWAPRYTWQFLRADLVAGITIASLAIPQGISYARLANLPPVLGLYSSFVPPLIYAVMGSSRDLAVGTVAVGSLLMASMLGDVVKPLEDPTLYLHLAFTATFFAGLFEVGLGIFRLGFIVDFLSHATIVGFMGGAATVVCLQQLKGVLGLDHFTHATDIISVMRSVFSQTHKWRWESAVLGCVFLFYLLLSRYYQKEAKAFLDISDGSIDICDIGEYSGVSHPCRETWSPSDRTLEERDKPTITHASQLRFEISANSYQNRHCDGSHLSGGKLNSNILIFILYSLCPRGNFRFYPCPVGNIFNDSVDFK
ncbi:Sulfate transporter 3.1 [Orobanche gracilis]